ncbi:SH3 and cysteine-rich domain-containing protein isoform X6 [Leptinotarsa decemlineata]|uniref:SH3 and cysteine-rich domain-containing protein isoform X6 n=1 Tax=Leptinotarsa decemlineata TaxID=7539 RepID=UPI003D30C841
MYVIFPADEVVYLSYGRLIYVPSSSSPENHLNTAPIRTNSLEESGINLSSELSQSRVDSYNPQSNEKPCTSRTADFGSSKTHSNPDKSKPSQPGLCNSLERPPPHRAINSNSTKSSTSSKKSSGSSKSTTALLECKEPDASSNSNPGTTKKLSGNSFKSFFKSRLNSEKTPESIPVRPERKKDKKLPTERKLSYNDYLTVGRERTEIPRSDIVNTRSDQVQDVKSEKPIKREKSPVFRFFRAQSSSPRTLGCDRTAFDFDGLFRQESNPGKLSVNSVLRRPGVGSESNLTNRQSSEKSPTKKRAFFSSQRTKRSSETEIRMAGNESPLRDLIHPAYNEHLKSHNAVSFKLVRTVSDFTQQLGQMYEQHAEELQLLVANFRKRNGELRKERPACPSSLFHTWETLLQEVEIDSQALGDIASILGRQVSRPLLERSFHRKIQSRKVFTHRESYETIIAKTEEKLAKCRQEYKNAYLSYLSAPSTESLSAYFNTHNAYIQQLHATNGMMEEFGKHTLPSLLQELEEIYTDLCSTVTEAVLQGAEVVSNRATERSRRYESLISQCKAVSGPVDLTHLARSLPAPTGRGPIMKRIFVPPQPPPPPDPIDGEPQDIQVNDNVPPPLRDELVIDRLSAVQIKPSHDALKKESQDLEAQIRQIQDALDTLVRIQQRSVEASLYNKANELQEDISMKRFDLRVAQIHLSAINSQKELFSNKMDGETVGRERKMSSASTGSMKTKWLKAFKSLKTPPPEPEKKNQMFQAVSTIMSMRKNGAAATRELLKGDPDAHNFQEYTYKKITPCDICSQVLRGHTRQGLKCRICKMNVHVDCQDKASKCQTKARLLRRQKSTSEIETRVPELNPDDETPHSPRRQKLNLRMKSLSLDSPESTEHVRRGRHHGANAASDPHSNQSSSSRIQFPQLSSRPVLNRKSRRDVKAKSTPSSPVHNRRLLSAKNIRMSSVELPDDNDKSPSSASTSPCPSPVGAKKSHRLLPTNLYVVLYNFKSRHQDELDLKAGYKVTVIDTSDSDWWKGKCLGRVGFFPSKYVSKLSSGEKPLQVTHNLQVSDGENGLMLLRDQIVIQIGEELDGMVMIRSGDNRQGICPLKFLQEV